MHIRITVYEEYFSYLELISTNLFFKERQEWLQSYGKYGSFKTHFFLSGHSTLKLININFRFLILTENIFF